MATALGIDFGTTNTSAALALENGETLYIDVGLPPDLHILRTAVYLEEGCEPVVGTEVSDKTRAPGVRLESFKSLLKDAVRGRTIVDRRVSPPRYVIDHLGEGMKPIGDKVEYWLVTESLPVRPGVSMDNLMLATKEVFKSVLRSLRRDYGDLALDQLVLSVPVDFPDVGKERIIDAALAAGIVDDISRISVLPEPLAVALAYGSERRTPRRVLVFDHGGGTLDVALVHIEGDPESRGPLFHVLGQGRHDRAGTYYDFLLFAVICDDLPPSVKQSLLSKLRVESPMHAMHPTLLGAVERCKIDLCKNGVAEFGFSIDGLDIVQTLDYSQFESALADELKSIRKLVDDVMEEGRCTAEALGWPLATEDSCDEVLLAGGSSAIPAIRNLLGERFPDRLNLEFVGSGTSTRGLAMAARYGHLVRNLTGAEYRLFEFETGRVWPLLARHTPMHMATWEHQARTGQLLTVEADGRTPLFLVVMQEGERWRPVLEGTLIVEPGRLFHLGIEVDPQKGNPVLSAAYCGMNERLSITQVSYDSGGTIPLLEQGQIIRWTRAARLSPGRGHIRGIRHFRQGLAHCAMAAGRLSDYVFDVDSPWEGEGGSCHVQVECNADLYLLDVPLPGPGERVSLVSHRNRFVQLKDVHFDRYRVLGRPTEEAPQPPLVDEALPEQASRPAAMEFDALTHLDAGIAALRALVSKDMAGVPDDIGVARSRYGRLLGRRAAYEQRREMLAALAERVTSEDALGLYLLLDERAKGLHDKILAELMRLQAAYPALAAEVDQGQRVVPKRTGAD